MAPLRRAEPRQLALTIIVLAAACGPAAAPIGQRDSGGGGGGGAAGDGGVTMSGTAIPLPMSVTAQFQNQGWFADDSVRAAFQPGSTVIKQEEATTGPCATRAPDARGKCLKIVYTPPPNLTPPSTGGWVGVFFLTTLLNDHPELTPPAKAGEANWGSEPGRNIAAGATKITFAAAADAAGTAVTFKAGTDRDSFQLPEQTEALGSSWKTYELSLAGQSYGSNVVGAFAWILKDTTKAATFYLDSIVWQ